MKPFWPWRKAWEHDLEKAPESKGKDINILKKKKEEEEKEKKPHDFLATDSLFCMFGIRHFES